MAHSENCVVNLILVLRLYIFVMILQFCSRTADRFGFFKRSHLLNILKKHGSQCRKILRVGYIIKNN